MLQLLTLLQCILLLCSGMFWHIICQSGHPLMPIYWCNHWYTHSMIIKAPAGAIIYWHACQLILTLLCIFQAINLIHSKVMPEKSFVKYHLRS